MYSLNIQYNPRIDQLRWLAATLVFLFHFHLEYAGNGGVRLTGAWTALITQGHTGVGLFFTLSGFLFMQIALRQHRAGSEIVYREFLRNRLLRILPLYLVIYLVATSIGRDKFAPQDLLYLFASNLGLAPTSSTVITGAAWTISLEFLFYLFFPFLARFTIERGVFYLTGWLVLMAFFKVAAYTVNENSTLMYFSTWVGRFDQFLIGMSAAMLHLRWRLGFARWAPLLLAASVALVFWDTALMHKVAPFGSTPRSTFWIFWPTLESAGWAALILAWISFSPRLPRMIERALSHGGKISFSFYLLHMGLLHIFASRIGPVAPTGTPWVDSLIMLVVTYGATWALSTLSYHIVEEPFLRMRRRYGAGQPQQERIS